MPDPIGAGFQVTRTSFDARAAAVTSTGRGSVSAFRGPRVRPAVPGLVRAEPTGAPTLPRSKTAASTAASRRRTPWRSKRLEVDTGDSPPRASGAHHALF